MADENHVWAMAPLDRMDVGWAVRRLPIPVFGLLKKYGPQLFLAGGYLRSIVAGERINDIDLFAHSPAAAKQFALDLAIAISPKLKSIASIIHETDNAYTVRTKPMMTQFIHRWNYLHPADAVSSFDFTIARAALWWNPETDHWDSLASVRFYQDLAAKRIVYCRPVRNEDAGGSLLRIFKFYQRGYRAPLDTMGAVVARLVWAVNREKGFRSEQRLGRILTALLHEVDPNVDPESLAHLPPMEELTEEEIEVGRGGCGCPRCTGSSGLETRG